MKAEMQIDINEGHVAMAVFIAGTTAKMLSHIAKRGAEPIKEDIHDLNGKVVGHWSLAK
jgi:hypothetical protein